MRLLISFVAVLLVVGCSKPVDLGFTDKDSTGTLERIYVATTRLPSEKGGFDGTQSDVTHYARYNISIPPSHTSGEIEWPKSAPPNPDKEFATTAKFSYDSKEAFQRSLRNRIKSEPSAEGRVYVYVHGFYNTFADGLYRAAQISNDFPGTPITAHFSWPSAGSAFGYAHDRDAILTARDSFEEFLRAIKGAGASEIVIIAHSLGSALTMETLRSIALEGKNEVPKLIKGVALIAPDIGVDLFVSQADRIGKLPDFFVIFTSEKDRALGLSARVSGKDARLGNLKSTEPIAHLDTIVVDVTDLESRLPSNHFTALENPEALEFIGAMIENKSLGSISRGETLGPIHSVAISMNNLTRVALSPE